MATLLIVDGDEAILVTLFELLSGEHSCHAAASAEEALNRLAS
jgi:CheY-like chemotaxis protein